MGYRLLAEFRELFEGHPYLHRRSTQGDAVSVQLYEDLLALDRSAKLTERISARQRVVNVANRRVGIRARRGDGTFGEIIPNEEALIAPGFAVGRGRIATIEIGAEVKILAKAMIKQIDRVIGDLDRQARQFKRGGGDPITVGIVAVNSARRTTGYEGNRAFSTDGGKNAHPFQEAAEAERRVRQDAERFFDHLLVIGYQAENAPPFVFNWANKKKLWAEYGAVLTRISRDYERRF